MSLGPGALMVLLKYKANYPEAVRELKGRLL